MSAARVQTLIHGWETVRYELLNTRICDLDLRIEGSPVEPFTNRLRRELRTKGLSFDPQFYLTDGWGCPDEVPVIGIPSTWPTNGWPALRKSRPARSKTTSSR